MKQLIEESKWVEMRAHWQQLQQLNWSKQQNQQQQSGAHHNPPFPSPLPFPAVSLLPSCPPARLAARNPAGWAGLAIHHPLNIAFHLLHSSRVRPGELRRSFPVSRLWRSIDPSTGSLIGPSTLLGTVAVISIDRSSPSPTPVCLHWPH